MSKNYKRLRRERIRRGMRERIRGTAARPRLSVFRSHYAIYVQAVDDATGRTLAASSSRKTDIGDVKGTPTDLSKAAGGGLGDRLKPGWVAWWLQGPQRWRKDVRCPDYGMEATDAEDLAAFIASVSAPPSSDQVSR